VLAAAGLAEDEESFVPLFDGKTLEGWTSESTDRYSVRDGAIVAQGGTGWLRYNKPFKDFELHTEFRAMKRGGDSGLIFRARPGSAAKDPQLPAKGYQLQLIDSKNRFAILGFGVAPPRFRRDTEALKAMPLVPGQWESITLRVAGRHADASLNGKPITVSDTIELPEGCIGLRGENGHFEWRNLKIKELPSP
jgi:hypothetical protein